METLIAENQFVVEASQERVWGLTGTVMLSSFSGLEKLQIIDENNFSGELKVKAFGIPLTMYVRGEICDISPPETVSVRLTTGSKWNLITLVLKVIFTSNSVGEGKTAIVYKAVGEALNPLIRWVLLGQVKGTAKQILDSFERHLKKVA